MRLYTFVLAIGLSLTCLGTTPRDPISSCSAALEALEAHIQVLQAEAERLRSQIVDLNEARTARVAQMAFDQLAPEDRPFAPVTKLELSVRARRQLESAGITTVGRLTSLSQEELAAYSTNQSKVVGQIVAAEVARVLAGHDLELRPALAQMRVRPAKLQDAQAIFDVAKLNKYVSGVETYRSYIERGIPTLVAESKGKIVGFVIFANTQTDDAKGELDVAENAGLTARLIKLEPKLYSVIQFGVHPGFERLGLGAALYAQMYDRFPSANFMVNLLEAPALNTDSQRFHAEQGFLRYGEAVADQGAFGGQGMKWGVYIRER